MVIKLLGIFPKYILLTLQQQKKDYTHTLLWDKVIIKYGKILNVHIQETTE